MLPILIVDDEPHIARLIEMTLEPLGQPLVLACDGEQAADLLEKQQFDQLLFFHGQNFFHHWIFRRMSIKKKNLHITNV